MRISVLDESLKKAGHCFATDTVPTSAEDKSANNNMMTLGFYFNLTKDSNCAKVAASGNVRSVVLNFIKKFQFPNMRTTAAFQDAKNDGIMLAPMREIIKILYTMNLLYGSVVAYLTKEEILYFLFYNENIAKRKRTNLSELINDIFEYRKTGVLPDSIDASEGGHEWKHEDRQIREMVKVLLWSGCIAEKDGKYVIDNEGLSRSNKADIFDIINYDQFWNGSTIESYREYMDIEEVAEYESGDDTDDFIDESDEYTHAAKIIKNHLTESGFEIPVTKEQIESAREEFVSRFNYKLLSSLSDEELLSRVFYTTGDNTEALCCWIEMNKDCKNYFGSISGGSAYKFGLFQKKETGMWTTGSPQKSQELTDEEAVQRGREIVNALVKGAEIIEKAELNSLADYEKLDDDLKAEVGEQFYNWAWFHKYYSIMFPEKLSNYHSTDWQCHVLRSLGIKPSEKYYARSGQISMIENRGGLLYREFGHVFFDKFGGIKSFVRMGTSDDEKSYVAEWKQRSVIGLGWKALGSLENYTAGDGVDRTAIAEKLEENYYPNDSKTASRKAGEIARFYKTDENTIFVAMAGEKLIAFVDDIGSYFYDGNSDMSHLKSGQWHLNFADGETLPTKSEGKLTSCYTLTDEENLMFLYKKYYYQDEEMQLEEISYDDEDPEERNKRLFKYWMSMQVKPEGDSNAGEPYSTDSINSYVSNIQNTPLPMVAERSVFYTTEIAQVQTTIEVLDNSEKKNNTQRSAVKKYLQYLIATKEDYMPLIFNTDIETKYERNRIVFGAPGTGKSYGLKDDCEKLMADTAGTYERVTFHPDYSYSQFVGTYKPVMDADGRSIRYDFVPGPFMRVYVDALKSGRTDAPQPHLLLIEEINRAKVAAVFGDVFQLLDRDDDGVSEYEIQASEDIRRYLAKELGGTADNYKKIRIPNNMFIWATMNSADQGVFPMDTAFKRRWNFEYLGINENEEKIQGIGKIMLPGSDEPIEWNMLRKAINDKMSSSDFKINEDKLMGPFFLSKKVIASNENGMIIDTERFIDAFKSKVIMYLYEDAVKQGKHRFFDGCDSSKYSSVCEAFDTMGTAIFGATFRETFYDKQRDDA